MKGSVSPGLAIGAAAVAIFAALALLFGFTAVSTEEEAALNVEFDPVTFVADSGTTSRPSSGRGRAPRRRAQPHHARRRRQGHDRVADPDRRGARAHHDRQCPRLPRQRHRHGHRRRHGDQQGHPGPRPWTATRGPSRCASTWAPASPATSRPSATPPASSSSATSASRPSTARSPRRSTRRSSRTSQAVDVEALVGKPVSVTGAFTLRTQNQPSVDVSRDLHRAHRDRDAMTDRTRPDGHGRDAGERPSACPCAPSTSPRSSRARPPSTTSPSTSTPARSTSSSARTAPASRR